MTRRGKSGPAGLALALLLTWLVLYPIVLLVLDGLHGDALRSFAARSGEWSALWASVWISLASVALAALVGVPLALLFEWFEFPGRKLLGALIALPAVLPPFVGVIAFLFLYGESGFVARFLQSLLGLSESPWRLQGAGAILLVHAYSMYVYFYLFTRAGLARLDGAMLELGSFSAPYVFGGGFRVMTTQIFASKQNGELGLATVETIALALVALVGLALLRRTEGDAILVGLGKGTAPRRRVLRRPLVRVAATLAGWGLAVALLLPHLTLLLVSLVPYATWTTETLPPVLSLDNYRRLFSEPERLEPLLNSFWMALTSTTGAVAVALAAGWLVVRRRVRVRGWIEGLLAIPWALPGTVFAVAIATAFSVSAPLALRWILVGTVFILPLAYLVRGLPVTGRAILAGFRQLDPALEEAAASLGAGPWRTLQRVTLPQLRPALATGASLAFVGALGDFVTSILLYTYRNRPISMEINAALRVNEIGVAAAFGVVLMVVSAIVLGIGARR